MGKFNEFIEALKGNAAAQELLGGKSKPESDEEMVAGYVAAAKELGFDLTAQDVVDGIKAMAQERLAKTEQAEVEVQELSEGELDRIAGGKLDDTCKYSFQDGENCWLTDACDDTLLWYFGYICKRDFAGKHEKIDLGNCDGLMF